MKRGHVDIAGLKAKIKRAAQRACLKGGLEARVYVAIREASNGEREVLVEVEEMTHIDGTDPRWEELRGMKWGDN